mmetsp:Transcript_10358/g.21301  ORF Transcript_10358/g.21301 Transcript_10358/m.21301 type:complete len:308 (-) Transcript_10358:1288-2211(-)
MLFPGRTRRGSIFFPHLQFPSDQLRIVFKGQRFTNCSGHCHVGSDTATDLDPGATASPLYSGTQSRFPDPASSDHIVPLRQSRRSLGDHKTRFQCANGSTWLLCVQRMQKHMHMHHTIVRGKNCCVFLLCRIRNESLSTEDASCESRRRCRESRVGHVHHGHAGGHVCPVPRCSRMRCATLSLTPSPRLMRWPWTLATACHTSAPWSTLNMLICSRESASLCHLRLSSCTCNHPSAQDMGQRTMSARKTRTPHPQCPRTMTTPTHITSHHIAPNIDDPPPRAVHATRTCMRGSHPTHTDRKSRRAAL